MWAGYIILSLLLVAVLDVGQATFVTGGAGVALAVAVGAAAVLGVGALGVGAALAGRRRGRRGGRGRGRGRRWRGRRDLIDDEEEDEDMWEMVSTNDQAGCARKLICLLEAAEGTVDPDEQVVLAFLGELTDVSQPQRTAKLPFETAGWLGKLRGARSCEQAYGSSCPHSRLEMMALIRSVWGRGQQQLTA